MLHVEIVHAASGKRYLVPANQVTVYADCGNPVALTYEHGGVIAHSDVGHSDFTNVCDRLHVKRIEVPKQDG